MTMRTFVGLCAALAFAVGSTAVHAVKILDTTGEFYTTGTTDVNPATTHDSVTYAMETLLKGEANMQAASDEDDETVYYNIVRPHLFAAPAGIAASQDDTYLVTYVLEGMVFSGNATIVGTAGSALGTSPVTGGSAGSTMAVFRTIAGSGGVIAKDAVIELQATVAVSAEGGSITRTVLNRTLEGIAGVDSSEEHSAPGIIKFGSALDEMVTATSPAPEAKAAAGFMNFGMDDDGDAILRVSLGRIVLGVKSGDDALRHARAATTGAANANVTTLGTTATDDTGTGITAGARAAETDPHTNPVTFSGDFSFAETVALGMGGCTATSGTGTDGAWTELRKSEGTGEDAMLTNETMPLEATTFVADTDTATDNDGDGTPNNDDHPFHLCVEVDGETEIPKTMADNPFQVMATYKGLVNADGDVTAAHPPMGEPGDLAMIGRDGASFRIPFLTTNTDLYKQLVIIVNHGAEAGYSFSGFQSQDGMASAGPMASGDLPTGQTVLRSTDIVMVDGGNRAAATLSVVTDQSNISVAVQQIRAGTGQADTVYVGGQ